ncbi:MAG: hypothetical protein ABIP74_03445 [Candidatus Saccharimonas sp.]
MTSGQKQTLMYAAWHMFLWVILPSVLLSIAFPNYWWVVTLIVILVNLVVRYNAVVVQWVREKHLKKEEREKEQLKIEAQKRELMFHHIEPSVFTRRFSRMSDEELMGNTYVDDPQHWIVAFRLFFNPLSERGGSVPDDRVSRWAYKTTVALIPLVTVVWIVLWVVPALVMILEATSAVFREETSSVNVPLILLAWVILMSAWTLAWGRYTRDLWKRDRFTVTEEKYTLTSVRTPFQNEEHHPGSLNYLMSVTLRRTVPGKIFGYGHITFQSWEDPEPISERRFVANPERIITVLDHFTSRNSKKDRSPLKTEKYLDAT